MEPAIRKHGKIAHGMEGAGTVTKEMVEQRAAENALIHGRDRVTDADRRAARLELLGVDSPEGSEDDLVGSGRTYANPGSTGKPGVREMPRDEQMEAEKLVNDGMEEAQHNTMAQGARSSTNQE